MGRGCSFYDGQERGGKMRLFGPSPRDLGEGMGHKDTLARSRSPFLTPRSPKTVEIFVRGWIKWGGGLGGGRRDVKSMKGL